MFNVGINVAVAYTAMIFMIMKVQKMATTMKENLRENIINESHKLSL